MRAGYEIDKLLLEPPEFWLYRIKSGRRVAKYGPYATEDRVREELKFQESLDRDDCDRARIPPPRKET